MDGHSTRRDAMDWTEELKPCRVCGQSVEAINLFPGKRCLACFEKHFNTLAPMPTLNAQRKW